MRTITYLFKKVPVCTFFSIISFGAISQTFNEGIGTASGTVQIATHESNNGFDNDALAMSGTADLRSSGASSGYSGASGGMYVNFAASQNKSFQISGIVASGLGCLNVSFGIYKSTTGSNGSSFSVQYSTDGTNFTTLSYAALPTGAGTDVWTSRSITGIPATTNLTLRFVSSGVAGLSFKLDDIVLTATPASAGTISISNASICSGGSVTLSGSTVANTSYQWQELLSGTWTNINGATNGASQVVNPSADRSYRRVDTGICGSANSNVVQVAVIADPTLSFNSSDVSCFGSSDGSASASVSGGTAQNSYSYNWGPGNPNGDGTASISQLAAGTYSLSISGALGCNASGSVEINEPEELIASSSATPILCYGDEATVSVSASGGSAPYSGTGEFTVSAGSYSYTVTDANGCGSITEIVIEEPDELVASSSASPILCNGGESTVTVSASGGTEPYSGTGDFTVSAGSHSFTVTDANGCSSITEIVVEEPAELSASSSATPILCNGGESTVTVSASGGTEPYSGTGDFAVGAGSHEFTVTDANGCSASTSIEISEPEALSIDAGQDVTLLYGYGPVSCASLSAAASGGTEAYSYSWESASSGVVSGASITACPTASEVYTATVVDANGCEASDELSICVVDVRCEIGRSGNYNVEMCQIPPGHPENAHTICVDESAVPAHLAMGCQLGACGELETACSELERNHTFETQATLKPAALSLFPNPAENVVTISLTLSKEGKYSVILYNNLGQELVYVYEGNFNEYENRTFDVNISTLENGIYMLGVSNGSEMIENIRVIKQ